MGADKTCSHPPSSRVSSAIPSYLISPIWRYEGRAPSNQDLIIIFCSPPDTAVLEGGKQLVAKSNYLAFACAGYAALTIMVWLNAYGKFPTGTLAWSLIVWSFLGLYVPAFWLMVAGTLPF